MKITSKYSEKELKEITTIETIIFSENQDNKIVHITMYSLGYNSSFFKTIKNGKEVYKGSGLKQAINAYFDEEED